MLLVNEEKRGAQLMGKAFQSFRNLGENRAELNGGYECHSSECLMEEPPAIHNDKSYPSIANRL